MTPKEKAKELLDKYKEKMTHLNADEVKEYTCIVVDSFLKHMSFTFGFIGYSSYVYWKEVKRELQKL
jgi:hypothetical protein